MNKIKIRIVENSLLAKIAAFKLKTDRVAIVWHKTIHLHHTSRFDFMKNQSWLLHELKHIEQFQKMGIIKFLWVYLSESIKNGYYNNALEIEARKAENDLELLHKYEFLKEQ